MLETEFLQSGDIPTRIIILPINILFIAIIADINILVFQLFIL